MKKISHIHSKEKQLVYFVDVVLPVLEEYFFLVPFIVVYSRLFLRLISNQV